MASQPSLGTGRLMAGIGLFVLLGVPLVAYLWEMLNQLMAGEVHPVRLLIAVPAAALFWLLLVMLSRAVHRWQGIHEADLDRSPPPGRPR